MNLHAGRRSWHRTAVALVTCLLLALGKLPCRAQDLPGTAELAPGDYLWQPQLAPDGPLLVLVSLDQQRAYVYRNGVVIGVSTISSGRAGFATPTGVFTILQRAREHYSNRYDQAPMPYMVRLTWDGVALHGGHIPGYPASHGCVRLPLGFARRLFELTRRGQTVVVADAALYPDSVVRPGLVAPVTATGEPLAPASIEGSFMWDESKVAAGPVSVVASLADRTVQVFRNGERIGAALLDSDNNHTGPSLLFVVEQGYEQGRSRLDPSRPRLRLTRHVLGGASSTVPSPTGLRVPPAFAQRLYDVLQPGATLLLTDQPALRGHTALQWRTVLEAGPAEH